MQHAEAISVFDRYPGLPTDVRRAFNRILDDHNIERMGRMELIAERDALRAELAAAKERSDGLYLGLRQTLEAFGGVAQPGVSEAFLILGVPGEAAAIKQLNVALVEHVERLRKALSDVLDGVGALGGKAYELEGYGINAERATEIVAALAATPAQSLAAHDAEVKVAALREVAVEIDALAAGPDIDTVPTRLEDIANGIRAKADRIEKEAANG